MGMQVGGKAGISAEMNVVPLIDILLVLLVIFMIIPSHQSGLQAEIPQACGHGAGCSGSRDGGGSDRGGRFLRDQSGAGNVGRSFESAGGNIQSTCG